MHTNKTLNIQILFIMVIVLIIAAYYWYFYILPKKPFINLATNISSVSSEMRDIEKYISDILQKQDSFPFGISEGKSQIIELPESVDVSIHSGDGSSLDPFQNNE